MTLTIDPDRRAIIINGKVNRPPYQTYEMIRFLSRYPGTVKSRDQIMDAIGTRETSDPLSLGTSVARARRFLKAAGSTAKIVNSHKIGYLWEETP